MVATHSTMQGLGSPMPEFSPTDVTTGRNDSSTDFADRRELRTAAGAVIAGRGVSCDQEPSMGCNIKWRPGSEPAWLPAG